MLVRIFLAAITFCSLSLCAQDLKNLELLYDKDRIGDRNQVFGIREALRQQGGELRKPVLLAVGSFGILSLLKNAPKGKFIAYVSHQETPDLWSLIGKADLIALPNHTISEKFRRAVKATKTQVVETLGVAHNLSVQEVQKEFDQFKNVFPKAQRYLCVMLGGDSQDPDNVHWTLFTKEDADRLAKFVIAKAKAEGFHILILNGPRTGMHLAKTDALDKDAHRGSLDAITRYFVEQLKKKKSQYTVFDFQYGQASMYQASLGLLAQTSSSVFLVPGESTSMISEAVDVLGAQKTWVYEHSAVQVPHRLHGEQEWSLGRIAMLFDSNFRVKAKKQAPAMEAIPAAQQIALAIVKIVNRK